VCRPDRKWTILLIAKIENNCEMYSLNRSRSNRQSTLLVVITTILLQDVTAFNAASALSIFRTDHERSYHNPISLEVKVNTFDVVKEEANRPLDQQRRNIVAASFGIASSIAVASLGNPIVEATTAANAADIVANGVEMKSFIDPLGLFTVSLPTRFYNVRRTAKGDLPDEKTGKGRRGSSIFTAGDLAKTEVVAVERYVYIHMNERRYLHHYYCSSNSHRYFQKTTHASFSFPTRVLLEENGIDTTGTNLSTFPDIGDPVAVANLITVRREKERPGTSNTNLIRDSVKISSDGKEMYFKLISSIAVQKPELLLEQTGVSELVRITVAKSSLRSNDGNLLTIFASALETDYKGQDGAALQEVVSSFQALERP
jgi:hypothetical protein